MKSVPASSTSRHINTCFVKDLKNCLARFDDLGWTRKSANNKSSNDNNDNEIFQVIEVNEVYAVISLKLSTETSLVLIENDIRRVNSPLYIYVDALDKFDRRFESQCKAEWDIVLDKFSSSLGVGVSCFNIDQLDFCFLDCSLRDDVGSVTAIVAEWTISRLASISVRDAKKQQTQIRREDVIAAALSWCEKNRNMSKSESGGNSLSNNNSNNNSNSSSLNSSSSSSNLSNNNDATAKTKAPRKKDRSSSDTGDMSDAIAVSVKKASTKIMINGFETIPATINFQKYYGRRLDNLFLSLYHKGAQYPITANSPAPIPFSTDFFEGRCLLMLNTMHFSLRDGTGGVPNYGPDLYAPRFEGTKYTFDVQVQGRFLKQPTGHLFFGAEITKKMELGLLTRSSCNVLLSIAKNINPFVHSSYGDSENIELPHIAAPLWSTLDKLVITPSAEMLKRGIYKEFTLSDKVPDIGGIFEETNEARMKRRKDLQFRMETDPESIFSMSFKSSQLEWVQWKLANIPLLGKMDLHTFWSDSDINLCMYSVPYGTETDNVGTMGGAFLPTKHFQKKLDHLFSVKIEHKSNHPEFSSSGKVSPGLDYVPQRFDHLEGEEEDATSSVKDEEMDDENVRTMENRTRRASLSLIGRKKADSSDEDENDDDEDRGSIEGMKDNDNSDSDNEDSGSTSNNNYKTDRSSSRSVDTPSLHSGNFVENNNIGSSSNNNNSSNNNSSSSSNNSNSYPNSYVGRNISTERFDNDPEFLASYMPIPLVMCAIEVDDRRSSRRNGRRFLYAFLENPVKRMKALSAAGGGGKDVTRGSSSNSNSSSSSASNCVLRSYKEFTYVFPVRKGSLGPTSFSGSGSGDGYYYGQSGPKPWNLSRLGETEVRLNELNAAYRDIMRQCSNSSSNCTKIREKLSTFLHSGDHTDSFLKNGQYNWIMKSSLRSGLLNFVMESLVLTKLSNTYWSEEVMGLTSDNLLVFIKSAGRVGKDQRSVIHISGILEVAAVDSFDHGFQIGDSVMIKISTFARQLVVMMRGGANVRDKWIGLLQHKMNEWNISQNGLNATSIFNGNSNVKGDLGKIALIPSNRNSQRKHHMDLLMKPKSFSLGEKEILNGRVFTVGAAQLIDPNNRLIKYASSPPVLVEKLLQLVLQLCEAAKNNKYCNGMIDASSGPTTPLSSDFLIRNGGATSNFNSPNPNSTTTGASVGNTTTASFPATPLQGGARNTVQAVTPGSSASTSAGSSAKEMAATIGSKMSSDDVESGSAIDVCAMSENIMNLWIEFMDGVSLLQAIDLDKKLFVNNTPPPVNSSSSGSKEASSRYDTGTESSEKEDSTRIALFINLYHLLLLHSFLILGLPQGTSDFITIFTKVAYEVGGDVVTLSDIEHCVLRHGMPRPNVNFIAQSLIPSHKYSYSLVCRRDFRLMWAINCGSFSNFPYITIYRDATLSQQLDANMEYCLESLMQISAETGTVVLPQIAQWYLKDFDQGTDGSATNRSVLVTLSSYINTDKELKQAVSTLLNRTNGNNKGGSVKFSFNQFVYKCRLLEGYNGSGWGYPYC